MPDKDLFVILKKVCIQIICIEKGEDKEEMENALHYKIRACHTQYQKEIVAHIHKRTELRPGEPKILEYLLEHEPCEQKQIATGCSLDPASVTGILKRMEERDLITREMKHGNRRSLYVSLTDFGEEMAEKVEESFAVIDAAAQREIAEEELEQFERILEKIQKNLSELAAEETVDIEKRK